MTDYYCQVHGQFADLSTWSTGLHVTSGQAPATLLTTWANAITDAWTNVAHNLNALFPVATAVESVSVATLNATMHEIAKVSQALPIPGTAGGDTLPFLNAEVISLRSNNIQKKGRGRMYLPAFEETFVNNNVVIPAATAKMRDAANAIRAAINADGSTIFVFNRKDTSALHPPVIPAFTKEVIVSSKASNKPARQSRRTRRVAAVYS